MTWTRTSRRGWSILLGAVMITAMVAVAVGSTDRVPEARGFALQARPRFHFSVERDGVVIGFFQEVSGIGSEHEVLEFRDGGDDGPVRKLPGRLKWNDVTLKRGITSDLTAWNWREQVIAGNDGFRSQVTIQMLNREGVPVAIWNFENAWPSKVTGPQPRSDDNTFGVEELVLVHEGMDRAS